jgi:hypothetical protein
VSVHVYLPTISTHAPIPLKLKKSISDWLTTVLPEYPVPQAPRAVCVIWKVVAVSVSSNNTQTAAPSKSLATAGGRNQSPSNWAGTGAPGGGDGVAAAGVCLTATDGVGTVAKEVDWPHEEARKATALTTAMRVATIRFDIPDPRKSVLVSMLFSTFLRLFTGLGDNPQPLLNS